MSQLRFAAGLLVFASLMIALSGAQKTHDYVRVQGRRIHVRQLGRGRPAVIFISGLGEPLDTWNDVQPAVSQRTLTLSYDRSGLGLSDPAGTQNRSAPILVAELHALLGAGKLAPPYILVGHSLGGSLAEIFAGRYPAETAGLVLVDPEDARLVRQLQSTLSKAEWAARSQALSRYGPMPAPVKREYGGMFTYASQRATLRSLPPVPMVLLTGTAVDPTFPGNPTEQMIKGDLHRQFLAHNPQAKQILVPESRHYIQNDAPAKVTDAVFRILASTQPHSPEQQER